MKNLFDTEFQQKLKAFFSLQTEYRRTGRTTILAKVLLETAIETGQQIELVDHFLEADVYRHAERNLVREVQRQIRRLEEKGFTVRHEIRDKRLSAVLIGCGSTAKSDWQEYKNQSINPFPIQDIKDRIEFLKNEELLLII